jgi:HD-GYP domain-containing protein (c-di-GMP phosphodiesterase class II)
MSGKHLIQLSSQGRMQVNPNQETAMLKSINAFFFSTTFDGNIPHETRQEKIIQAALILNIVILVILLPINYLRGSIAHGQDGLFYTICNLGVMLLLTAAWALNDYHKVRASSILYMVGTFVLCLTAFPLQEPDQLLLYFAIPNVIVCFITEKKLPLVFLALSILSYSVIYFLNGNGIPYNFFSVIFLILITISAWKVADILDRMYSQLVEAYDTTIEGWSQALEMRSQETEGHSHRVVELTMRLVRAMKVDGSLWVHINRGVLLHDIGKMGVPDTILCKPGPLTPAEWELMRQHPVKAYQMLSKIPYLQPAIEIPYCHHEKWDGTGYPRGLKGEEIPLEARIFSVIDVWDAMRSHRSYRNAIPENQVIEYLSTESGRSFDPAVIKAFFEMMKFRLPEAAMSNSLVSLERAPAQREP